MYRDCKENETPYINDWIVLEKYGVNLGLVFEIHTGPDSSKVVVTYGGNGSYVFVYENTNFSGVDFNGYIEPMLPEEGESALAQFAVGRQIVFIVEHDIPQEKIDKWPDYANVNPTAQAFFRWLQSTGPRPNLKLWPALDKSIFSTPFIIAPSSIMPQGK